MSDTKPNLNKNSHTEEDEIDLIQLAKTLWEGRKTVIKTTLVFMFIGLFIAIFSAKEYTAKTIMVPQTADAKLGGNLGGLAAMAGINLGSMGGGEGIPPSLYPQIVQSIPFQKELIKTPLQFKDIDTPVSYQEYYKNHEKLSGLQILKKYTIGLPGLIIKAIKSESTNNQQPAANNQLIRITAEEKGLFEKLQGQLNVENNDKDGYITLSYNMPEAIPSAQMAQKSQELLQQCITELKVKKAQEQLQFITKRYNEKTIDFKEKQATLANFQDSNRGLSTSAAQTRLQQLQSESDLAFSVLSELAKQVETQKIQVKEDTPVFTIIEPVSVPVGKAKPKRALILLIWTFLGGIVGIVVVFGMSFAVDFKGKWNEGRDVTD